MANGSDDIIPKRIHILGVPVDVINPRKALDRVLAMLDSEAADMILAVNPEKVIAAQRNPDLMQALENAALIIPDGIGVVAAAKLLQKESMERVAGADLMPEICRLAASTGKSIFMFGAKAEIVQQAALLLRERFPGLQIAGTHHGYVGNGDSEAVVAAINATDAKILFVGLGSPRQELWMNHYRHQLNVRICQGVGGSFDALCGQPKRAPQPIQKIHLEWLYRLVSQPKRLVRQNALPSFVFQVIKQYLIEQT